LVSFSLPQTVSGDGFFGRKRAAMEEFRPMPTYSYECGKCGHVFDVFHAMSATPKVHCEMCHSARTTKLMGIGSGIIFKGSGFYETDFKDKKGTKPEKSASSKSKPAAKETAKAETKPASDK